MEVGQRIRKYRLERGLSQRDLAAPRYTAAHLSTIETGRRNPSRPALEYFASRLGVDVDELATGRPPNLVTELEYELHRSRVAISAGEFKEATQCLRRIALAARRHRLVKLQGKVEILQALGEERQGNGAVALQRYEVAERLLSDEPLIERVDAITGKARCFRARGDIRYAIHLLESLHQALEREGLLEPNALLRVHTSLLHSYLEAELYEHADASAQRALSLINSSSDLDAMASMYMRVARLLLERGSADAAQDALTHAEGLFRQLDLQTELGSAHLARSIVLSRNGDVDHARLNLEIARRIYRQTRSRKNEARALNEMGRIERLVGDLNAAARHLEDSISLTTDGDLPIRAWAHRELAQVRAEQQRPTEAEHHFANAVALYERCDRPVELAITYGWLAELRRSMGRDEAYQAYRTAIQILEKGR